MEGGSGRGRERGREVKDSRGRDMRAMRLTSGECLHISESAEAAILLRSISGSCTARTSRGTQPLSTTVWASSTCHERHSPGSILEPVLQNQ